MINILYLYYNQPSAVKHLEAIGYSNYPAKTIIVDDGSNIPLSCSWADVYRIDEDIPWNQPVASNLGFSKIDDNETVLKLDIDHWIDLYDLLKLPEIKENIIINFKRIRHDIDGNTKEINAAPNIYLTKASTIKKVGGYNESFSGCYGYDDKELMYKLKHNGCKFITHDSIMIHVNTDSSTKGLNRDTSRNKMLYLEIINKNKSNFL